MHGILSIMIKVCVLLLYLTLVVHHCYDQHVHAVYVTSHLVALSVITLL